MIQMLAAANQAPQVTADEILTSLRRTLSARAGAISNYVALLVLVVTMAAVPLPGLFIAALVSFAFAIPLPMMERRGLTMLKGGLAGYDAMLLSTLLAALFSHTLWDYYVLHSSGIDFTVRLSSFMALPALFDLMARLARREAVPVAQAVLGGAASLALLSHVRLPRFDRD